MQHPEEGIIHAWLDSALPANEASAIEAHVAACRECEARVAEARGLIAASSRIVSHLDVVPGGVIPAAKAGKSRWIFSAWPAAIAATLVIGIGLVSIRGKSIRDSGLGTRDSIADSRIAVPESLVAQPPREVGPQRVAVEDRSTAKIAVKEPPSVQLPPANAAVQKSTIAAAPPTPAPRPTDSLQRVRLARSRSEVALSEVVVSAATGRSLASASGRIAAGGSAAVASAPPPVAATADSRQVPEPTSQVESVSAFVGCYENGGVTTRTPVTRAPQPPAIPRTSSEPARALPPNGYAAEERYDRFALMDEAAATPGQLAVRTLDPAGKPDQMIYGAGWSIQGDRAIVRNSRGQIVLALVKTDSGVRSPAVRVISCSK